MSNTQDYTNASSFLDSQGSAGSTDIVTALSGISRLLSALVQIFQGSFATGTFTMAAAATTTVVQPGVKSGAIINLTPTNAAAGSLVGSAKSPYISTITPGASFIVATADGTNAAGTETFSYYLKNP